MAKNIKFGESSNFVMKNRSVTGIDIAFNLFAKDAGTAISSTAMVDLKKMKIKATLKQFGKETIVCNDNMRNLFALSSFGRNFWQFFANNQKSISVIKLENGEGIVENLMLPLIVDFGGIINLKGDDTLTIEYECGTDVLGATVDNGISNGTMDGLDGVGIQYATPILNQHVIPTNASEDAFDCGDLATTILFVNYDKLTKLSADRVVTNVNFTSDKFNRSDNVDEIILKQRVDYNYLPIELEPFNSVLIYSGKELLQPNVNLQLNGDNVNATQNYLLVRRFEVCEQLTKQASSMETRHSTADYRAYNRLK